jgi:hypothetical protein
MEMGWLGSGGTHRNIERGILCLHYISNIGRNEKQNSNNAAFHHQLH